MAAQRRIPGVSSSLPLPYIKRTNRSRVDGFKIGWFFWFAP
jgi:hypothetical protein